MADESTHPADLPVDRLLRDCEVTATRRGGPGGQHRNRNETAVVIVHRPTGLRASASERRSQVRNRSVAVHRLRVRLALTHRCERKPDRTPSPLLGGRLHDGRIAVDTKHTDYPSILAEVLDVLAACGYDQRAASGWIGCTPSQLVRFLKREPEALQQANEKRAEKGEAPLR